MAATKSAPDPRLAALIENHRSLAGPLLPILHSLQEEFGYVDDAAVPMIAASAEPDAGRSARRRRLLSRFPPGAVRPPCG